MKKIGIFGGTFNPVHNGHVQLALHYIDALKLDRLLVVPACQPPHKNAPGLASAKERYKMCRLAFKGIQKAEVTDLELKRSGKSYTIDTVEELSREMPCASFYLLVGSDMFLSFQQWRDWKRLLSLVTLCTAARNAGEVEQLKRAGEELSQYGKQIAVFDFPVLPMSSTEIRQRISQGEDCSQYLNKKVYSYLLRHELYQTQQGDQKKMETDYIGLIKGMLKEDRFLHSVNVAEQAQHLAELYGENIQKAYVAGILHDVCKNMPKDQQLQWMEKSDIILDSIMLKQPLVWHGFAGAEYLRIKLNIQDRDILNAVRYHTIAREGMSRLEKIVYLADLTSKERKYPDVEEMRKAAEQSLEGAMRKALQFAVKNQVETGRPICLDTCRAYNQYLNAE